MNLFPRFLLHEKESVCVTKAHIIIYISTQEEYNCVMYGVVIRRYGENTLFDQKVSRVSVSESSSSALDDSIRSSIIASMSES